MSVARMQAVTFREFGAPDVLQVSEVDGPEPDQKRH